MKTNPFGVAQVKDLTLEAPRSPRERLGDYVILARTIDKCRALLAEKAGVYHYNCPLDQILFSFKEINAEDFKRAVKDGLSDEDLLQWVNDYGARRDPDEIQRWAENVEEVSLINDPEKRDYFINECQKLSLNPSKTSIFDWLEADDRACHPADRSDS